MIAEGYPAQQVLLQLQGVVVPNTASGAAAGQPAELTDKQRSIICELLAEADKDLVDGADEFLQLLNVAGSTQAALIA
jgi:replication factor C subunit 2/4